MKRKHLWIGTPGKHLKMWRCCPFLSIAHCGIDKRIRCDHIETGQFPEKCPAKLGIDIQVQED